MSVGMHELWEFDPSQALGHLWWNVKTECHMFAHRVRFNE